MEYIFVEKLGKKVSRIGLGTHQFGGDWNKNFTPQEVSKIIDTSHKKGINFIDTAGSYGPHLSEKLIGASINRDNRKHWVLASKFGYEHSEKGKFRDFSKKGVAQQLNKTLKCLNTDYLDIFYFHSGSTSELQNQELWTFLDNKVENKEILTLGLSISQSFLEKKNYEQLDIIKDYNISFLQVVYNLLDQKAEQFILPYCKNNGIFSVAKVPLAKGILSGKYKIGHEFKKNDTRSEFGRDLNNILLDKANKLLKTNPKIKHRTSWALKSLLNHNGVDFVIPGVKNTDQVNSNLALF